MYAQWGHNDFGPTTGLGLISSGDKISSTLVVKQINENPIESACNTLSCNSCFNDKFKETDSMVFSVVTPDLDGPQVALNVDSDQVSATCFDASKPSLPHTIIPGYT